MAYIPTPSAPTISGEIIARDFKPSGKAGATAASRYAGATVSGAPTAGTFAVGDYVIAQNGSVWICTVAGSPGTWFASVGALAQESDVSLSSLADTQVLTYSTSLGKWTNKPQSGAPTGGLVPIQEVVVGVGGQATIEFSSIPQIYRHLRIEGAFVDNSGNNSDTLYLRLNNDSGTNYETAGIAGSQTQALVGAVSGGASGTSRVDTMDAMIFNYTSTTTWKLIQSTRSRFDLAFADIGLLENAWRPLSAVNDVLLFSSSGSFAQGTVATLYGVMGTGAAYGGGPMTVVSSALLANVSLTSANTYYDGPSVNLTAGTWLVLAEALTNSSGTNPDMTMKLWNGTSVYALAEETRATGGYFATLRASAVVTLTSPDTVKLSVASNVAGGIVYATAGNNSPGTNNATYVQAVLLSTAGTSNIVPAFATKTANYSVTSSDSLLVLTATGITVTLPLAASLPPGRQFWIKNAGVTANTVAASGADTIDGAATVGLPNAYMALTLVSDGAASYYVI